jgi:uncharacterized protein
VASRGARTGARKSIFDPVHGPIQLDGVALSLVGTPEFQRLWGIRQTGFAHLVFPGANHTRLEHSLGTFWVAGRMAERIGLPEPARALVTSGALLHDLGHGPFSHTLDGPMREVLGVAHERLSRARIEGTDRYWPAEHAEVPALLERHGLRPRDVADLIDPRRGGPRTGLLRELLHGPIDADRIDYLQRDAHYTGVAHGAIDAVRLLDTLRVDRGRLAFAEKGRSAVEGFLVGRALMYSTVYYHRTVRAAEMMAQAAFERQPGYPGSARDLFRLTDAEMLVRLQAAPGIAGVLVGRLLERRLYKRAHGWTSVEPGSRWHRLLRRPAERRRLEDEIAAHVGGRPGEVVVDLGALEPHTAPGDDWARVALVGDRQTSYPFRGDRLWDALAARRPTDWAVSVFVVPRLRAAAARWLARDPRGLP